MQPNRVHVATAFASLRGQHKLLDQFAWRPLLHIGPTRDHLDLGDVWVFKTTLVKAATAAAAANGPEKKTWYGITLRSNIMHVNTLMWQTLCKQTGFRRIVLKESSFHSSSLSLKFEAKSIGLNLQAWRYDNWPHLLNVFEFKFASITGQFSQCRKCLRHSGQTMIAYLIN